MEGRDRRRRSTRCWAASSSRASGSTAATTRSTRTRRSPASRRRRRSRRCLDPDPSTHAVATRRRRTSTRSREGDTVALYVQDQLEFRRNGRRCSACARSASRPRRARPRRSAVSAAPAGPFSRTDNMVSGRAGLIWQPTPAQSYYVVVGQLVQPVRRARRLRRHGADQPQPRSTRTSIRKRTRTTRSARSGTLPGLQLRAALFRNEKTNARMADRDAASTVLAGKRRVDGIEFEATGSITPNWDIYSGIAFMDGKIVNGPANVQGKTPLGVADVPATSGRSTGSAAAGRSAAACAGRPARGSPTRTSPARQIPATSCWTRRPPTCRSSTRCGSTSTTSPTRRITSAATTTSRTACCPARRVSAAVTFALHAS